MAKKKTVYDAYADTLSEQAKKLMRKEAEAPKFVEAYQPGSAKRQDDLKRAHDEAMKAAAVRAKDIPSAFGVLMGTEKRDYLTADEFLALPAEEKCRRYPSIALDDLRKVARGMSEKLHRMITDYRQVEEQLVYVSKQRDEQVERRNTLLAENAKLRDAVVALALMLGKKE